MGGCAGGEKKRSDNGKEERSKPTIADYQNEGVGLVLQTYDLSSQHPQGKITEKQLKDAIDKIFEEYDLDKNGHLDINEIGSLMQKSLGKGNASEAEIKEFLKITDSNGNNQIEKEELYALYKKIYC